MTAWISSVVSERDPLSFWSELRMPDAWEVNVGTPQTGASNRSDTATLQRSRNASFAKDRAALRHVHLLPNMSCRTERGGRWQAHGVEIFSFDAAAGHKIDHFGSDFVLAPLMQPTDRARTVCMHFAPGGLVAEHEAMTVQLFCVISGGGWVSGDDGQHQAIKAFEAARWTTGERHAAGTAGGMIAMVIEGEFSVVARPVGTTAGPQVD